jgi:hypothetical protein
VRSSRRPTRRCRSSRRASSPGSVMSGAARGPGSTPRSSPRMPRWPSACSSGSAQEDRCHHATSSASPVRRRTGSGCRRTSCAPCSRRTPSRA